MQAGMIQVLRVSASDDHAAFPTLGEGPKTSGMATASTPMAMTASINDRAAIREVLDRELLHPSIR